MKKTIKRVLCGILAAAITIGGFAACGGGEKEVDESKTQLYVGIVDSGYGRSWLQEGIKRFEAENANTSFENGKTGIQVFIDSVTYGNTIAATLKGIRTEVIYSEDLNYYDLVNGGYLYDMTATVKEKLTAFGEDESIESKLSDSTKDLFEFDGKYYALPFVSNSFGIVYDRDMFENEGWFFLSDGTPEKHAKYNSAMGYSFGKPEADLSSGPNGIVGDYDDGLPATFDQFFALCNKIAKNGKLPITWAGKYPEYVNYFLYNVWANGEGFDNMKMNYTFSGKADDLVERVDENGNITFMPETEISEDNGYLLNRQKGKYDALDFLYRIVKNGFTNNNYYDENQTFNENVGHLDAQDAYLLSSVEASKTPIAMMIEGTHWENEATDTFTRIAARFGSEYSKENRRFGVMPIPHATEERIGQKPLFCDSSSALTFINGNIAGNKVKAATEFVKFMHTDKSLSEFNRITSLCSAFDYEITESDYNAMTYFGKSNYEHYKHSELFIAKSKNPLYLKNYSTFSPLSLAIWQSNISGNPNKPVSEFRKGTTAVSYFNGISGYYSESFWNKSIKK